MTDSPKPAIFIADDDDSFRGILARELRAQGYDVVEAATHAATYQH